MANNKKKKATIKDVAELAGLSVATVSAVINERVKKVSLSDASREKVLKAIKKLDYKVNTGARALRMGKSYLIGVIASDMTQPFTGVMLGVVERETRKRNYSYLVSDIQNDTEREAFYLDLFRQKMVEGIVYVGASMEPSHDALRQFEQANIPVVMTESHDPDLTRPCVAVDNFSGAYTATQHLIQNGCTKLLHITATNNIIAKQRMDGCVTALTDHDLKPAHVESAKGLTFEDGYMAMCSVLKNGIEIDSLFAFNDALAIGAMKAIDEAGLAVPDDIAIVGFDDIPVASYHTPSLTTVRQPVTKIAKIAIQLLMDILEKKYTLGESEKVVLETELIVRRSSIKNAKSV